VSRGGGHRARCAEREHATRTIPWMPAFRHTERGVRMVRERTCICLPTRLILPDLRLLPVEMSAWTTVTLVAPVICLESAGLRQGPPTGFAHLVPAGRARGRNARSRRLSLFEIRKKQVQKLRRDSLPRQRSVKLTPHGESKANRYRTGYWDILLRSYAKCDNYERAGWAEEGRW